MEVLGLAVQVLVSLRTLGGMEFSGAIVCSSPSTLCGSRRGDDYKHKRKNSEE
jgi:hypothetical protein